MQDRSRSCKSHTEPAKLPLLLHGGGTLFKARLPEEAHEFDKGATVSIAAKSRGGEVEQV